ncbi:hypothetical protein PseudUWO311_15130 [Pseudanabaena sp. UWO311]|uniref:hypothetical protein n=1 Tax=Pseudanabaena sp. UWO311 TaxID=2487337 RepID=UPI00115A6F32|nr:hypothetical protein [Pseudanabaena sp. UWO311]TYQ25557.1 hypothetical protein PseudUWO311_15130 [Pseudanabaena sp. UWO311]
MDNNLQIKFSWGTFCRRVIIDKDTEEVSLIDIIPALNVEQVSQIKLENDNQKIIASLGQVYVAALFEKVDCSDDEINEKLNIELLQTGLPSVSMQVDILIKSIESSTFLNLNLGNLLLTTSLDISEYNFEVIYRLKEQELGRVVMPVRVKFKLLDNK